MSFLPRSVFLVSLAAGLTALSLTSAAHAGSSCTKDADCGEGFRCDLVPAPSVSCGSSDGKPCDDAPDAPTTTTGYCREKAINCDTDAQCPSYLSCQTENVGSVTCAAPACAPGEDCPEPTCEEPTTPPDAAKLCAPRQIECTADSQCPADFACNIKIGAACDDIACAPGTECPEPTCGDPKSFCGPKQIDCQTSSDCPSDWRCLSFEESSCSGGGSDPDDGGIAPPSSGGSDTPVPAPKGGSSKPLDTSDPCTTTTKNLCVPRGYLGGLESRASGFDDVESSSAPGVSNGGSGKDSGAPTYSAPQGTTANAAASSGGGDGGCSTSGGGSSGGLVGAMLVALGACLARRRR